jgi:hypothetical protein
MLRRERVPVEPSPNEAREGRTPGTFTWRILPDFDPSRPFAGIDPGAAEKAKRHERREGES